MTHPPTSFTAGQPAGSCAGDDPHRDQDDSSNGCSGQITESVVGCEHDRGETQSKGYQASDDCECQYSGYGHSEP